MRELSVSTIVGKDWRDLRPSLAVLPVLWLEFGNPFCQCDGEVEQFLQGSASKYVIFSGIREMARNSRAEYVGGGEATIGLRGEVSIPV